MTSTSNFETPQPVAENLLAIINKEIIGIQLLWEALDGLFFKLSGEGLAALESNAPLFFRLIQTALMESLLMRVSRLMDPKVDGKSENLCLATLVDKVPAIADDVKAVQKIWKDSELKMARNKYLSHNDLVRSLKEEHTLNIPLEPADIAVLGTLVDHLRKLRKCANLKLTNTAYIDQHLDAKVRYELDVMDKLLVGGEQFFKLLPDHEQA